VADMPPPMSRTRAPGAFRRTARRGIATAPGAASPLRQGVEKAPSRRRPIVCRWRGRDGGPSWANSSRGKRPSWWSRCGMGACQGKTCGPAAEFLSGGAPGSVRPPVTQCAWGAGRRVGSALRRRGTRQGRGERSTPDRGPLHLPKAWFDHDGPAAVTRRRPSGRGGPTRNFNGGAAQIQTQRAQAPFNFPDLHVPSQQTRPGIS